MATTVCSKPEYLTSKINRDMIPEPTYSLSCQQLTVTKLLIPINLVSMYYFKGRQFQSLSIFLKHLYIFCILDVHYNIKDLEY